MKCNRGVVAAIAAFACVVASIGFASKASAQGVTWYVDNTVDAYTPPAKSTVYTQIQVAVDLAADGDTIKVYPGTYTSTSSEVVNLRGKAIVLEAAIPMVVGNFATYALLHGWDQRRCIVATLNETNATVVRGLYFQNGRASAGAGMYVVNGDPRIEDCYFANNNAVGGVASGGALRLLNSASVVRGCTFESNTAEQEGGAIFNANGPLLVDDCEFINNRAPRGGGFFTRDDASVVTGCVFRDCSVGVVGWVGLGLYAQDSHVTIWNSQFERLKLLYGCNSCGTNFGGGLQVVGALAQVQVFQCQFTENRVENNGRGGAISIGVPGNNRGSLRVLRSVFQNNSTNVDGGAIAMQSLDRLEIDGEVVDGVSYPTIFENNSANRYGGAISINVDWVGAGTFLLDHSRFVNNAAGSSGGAIWIRQTDAAGVRRLTDSVFTTNSAANGGGLFLEGTAARSQLGRTVYCGNDPNDIQGSYLESDSNCFTTSCADVNPANGFPDTCEPVITDCNNDLIADDEQLVVNGVNNDVNNDLVPDDCQADFLDFLGLESELVPIEDAGSSGYPSTTALCWRVYAKTINPTASVICVYGNAERTLSISASGGLYQHGSGGDTVEGLTCTKANPVLYDSYFTIEAECNANIELLTTAGFPAFTTSGNFSTNNGAYYVTPGADGSAAGIDHRILLMQLTTNTAIKPATSINILGRHGMQQQGEWLEWQAFSLAIPDPIMVDCNNNGIHDAIEIASGQTIDSDRNGLPDACQQCQGDVDGNGTVDVDDLIEIFLAWNDPIDPAHPNPADLNADGVVNAVDLVEVISGWGTCNPPTW